jgi:hypothetical protein
MCFGAKPEEVKRLAVRAYHGLLCLSPGFVAN